METRVAHLEKGTLHADEITKMIDNTVAKEREISDLKYYIITTADEKFMTKETLQAVFKSQLLEMRIMIDEWNKVINVQLTK